MPDLEMNPFDDSYYGEALSSSISDNGTAGGIVTRLDTAGAEDRTSQETARDETGHTR
jgi:hypothetical protein